VLGTSQFPDCSKDTTMNTDHFIPLLSGANRGLGKRFAARLIERGAKVYAAARRPETIDVPGVEPIQLDITDSSQPRSEPDELRELRRTLTYWFGM
jgi:NAD(P)-dependent dehydrogenase (short-subunit alcohol dehydrogenase family)